MKIKKHLLSLLILGLLYFTPALSTVLGIDFGSDKIKVAAVQPGRAFEIVLDEASKRSHPSLIVFDDDVRQYGTSASSLVTRRPQKSFLFFNRLLGKPYGTKMIEELQKDHIFNEIVKDDKRGTIRFKSPYYDPEHKHSVDDVITAQSYSVEEITSMKLKHIKKIARKYTEGEVTDCVMTVPEFWSSKERQALKDAAQLAGLNVYGLINENTAAAVQYGLKQEFSSNKTEYLIIYNMGSTSTISSIVKYWAYEVKERSKTRTVGSIEILSQTWDETLGGNSFDQIISQILIKRAKELLKKQTKPKIEEKIINSLQNDPRFTARIRNAAAKAKKILSANTDTYVGIESVYNDIDFSTTITRDELYENSKDLFRRAMKPLDDGIESLKGKIEKSDLNGIVLVGGGTRIPKIKDLLSEYLGIELRQDLNADEAPAMGAAFRAANLSSTFRVMGVNMQDITPFAVGVKLSNLKDDISNADDTNDNKFSKRGSLFNRFNNVYKRRAVSLKHDSDLRVKLRYEDNANLPMDTSNELATYEIRGIEDAILKYRLPDYNITEDELPKITISFLLDADGIVDLIQATATFTEIITEEKKVKKKTTDTTTNTSENTEDAEVDATGNSEKSDSNTEDTTTNGDSDSSNNDSNTESEDEYEMELISRKRNHKIDLSITKILPNDVKSYDASDFEQSQRILLELDDRDRAVLETAHERNALESYIFESRSKLYEDSNVEKVSTEEERNELLEMLTSTEDWIYEVEEETASIFTGKINELAKIGDKIFSRAFELQARPKAIDAAGKAIGQLYEYIETLKLNYSWVNETDTERLYEMTKRVEDWLNEKIEEQSDKSLLEEPAFLSKDVQRRIVPVLEYANKLLSKPKPYDYYKKKKSKNATKSDNETETETDTETKTDGEDDLTVNIDVNAGGEEGDSGSEPSDNTDTDIDTDSDTYATETPDGNDDNDNEGGEKKGEL